MKEYQPITIEQPKKEPTIKISVMPSKELLELFLNGLVTGKVEVLFDKNTGTFRRLSTNTEQIKPDDKR